MGGQPQVSVIEFAVPLPHVGLRRNSETRNTRYRAALKRQFQEDVWIACSTAPAGVNLLSLPWARASVHYIWYSTHATDADNIISTMKPALDVLKATGPRPLAILVDDGPGVSVTAEWKKAAKRTLEGVTIRITREEERSHE